MNHNLTFINDEKNKVIIERENGERYLTEYNKDIDNLLSREILIEEINSKLNDNYTKTTTNKAIINIDKKNIIRFTILPIASTALLGITSHYLTPNLLVNTIFGPISESILNTLFIGTAMTMLCAPVVIHLHNNIKRKKSEIKNMDAECEYLLEKKEEENNKLEELKQSVNLEKNSKKLETKTISAKEELQNLRNELISCINQQYTVEESQNSNSIDENNKQMTKKMK